MGDNKFFIFPHCGNDKLVSRKISPKQREFGSAHIMENCYKTRRSRLLRKYVPTFFPLISRIYSAVSNCSTGWNKRTG